MAKKYSQKFEKFFNLTRIFSKICGVDMVREDYRMTWVTWSLIGLINISIAFTVYTVYIAIAVNDDWIDVIKCLCMFCTGIQDYVKLLNGLHKRDTVPFLHKEIIEIYVIYEQREKSYHQLLAESIQLVKKLIIILLSIIIFVSVAVIGVPIFYQTIFHERIFIMPFYFPYVDYASDYGYYFTSMFHAVCVVFGVFGGFINDSWCFIFVAHIPLIKNILQAKFNELDQMSSNPENKDKLKINDLLLDIFKWHQRYQAYCNAVKRFFFWVIFVQVALEFVSIVCTIVCIFMRVWPAAPVFLVYSFSLFYFHCALGNLVEISNDDVTTMIYSCCWYNLTVEQQKLVLIMLRESQQAEGMTIGGVAPLSLHTALRLTKTIYTFSMILSNSLD